MTQEAKIDALEHVVTTLMKELKLRQGLDPEWIFEKTKSSIMGSNGPGGPTQKAEAMDALQALRTLII
jgi:carbamoylphosphate synthase small subunit